MGDSLSMVVDNRGCQRSRMAKRQGLYHKCPVRGLSPASQSLQKAGLQEYSIFGGRVPTAGAQRKLRLR